MFKRLTKLVRVTYSLAGAARVGVEIHPRNLYPEEKKNKNKLFLFLSQIRLSF